MAGLGRVWCLSGLWSVWSLVVRRPVERSSICAGRARRPGRPGNQHTSSPVLQTPGRYVLSSAGGFYESGRCLRARRTRLLAAAPPRSAREKVVAPARSSRRVRPGHAGHQQVIGGSQVAHHRRRRRRRTRSRSPRQPPASVHHVTDSGMRSTVGARLCCRFPPASRGAYGPRSRG